MTEAPSSSQRAQGNRRLIVISLRLTTWCVINSSYFKGRIRSRHHNSQFFIFSLIGSDTRLSSVLKSCIRTAGNCSQDNAKTQITSSSPNSQQTFDMSLLNSLKVKTSQYDNKHLDVCQHNHLDVCQHNHLDVCQRSALDSSGTWYNTILVVV